MDRAEAFEQVAAQAQRGASVEELMPRACDLCDQVYPDSIWEQIRAIDWAMSRKQSHQWLEALLVSEPPGANITGFWFGIFNPIYADPPPADSNLSESATSDFYIQGSATYPVNDWVFDRAWRPAERYAHSFGQDQIYRLAFNQIEDEVLSIADYVLTFAHAAGMVNTLIESVDRSLWLGSVQRRGIAVGHDAGDAIFLGDLVRAGFDRGGAGWI
jgi:hypothetical protein